MFGGGGWLVFSQPCEDEARNAIAQSSGRAGRRKSRVSVVGKKARGAMNRARATDRSGRVRRAGAGGARSGSWGRIA